MSTQIWKADIVLEQKNRQVKLESVSIKRLPILLLLSDTHFIKSLKLKLGRGKIDAGEKEWDRIKFKNDFPMINIEYISYLGNTTQEPYICD